MGKSLMVFKNITELKMAGQAQEKRHCSEFYF